MMQRLPAWALSVVFGFSNRATWWALYLYIFIVIYRKCCYSDDILKIIITMNRLLKKKIVDQQTRSQANGIIVKRLIREIIGSLISLMLLWTRNGSLFKQLNLKSCLSAVIINNQKPTTNDPPPKHILCAHAITS